MVDIRTLRRVSGAGSLLAVIMCSLLLWAKPVSAQDPATDVYIDNVDGYLVPANSISFDIGVGNNTSTPILVSKVELVDVIDVNGQCGREWFADGPYIQDPTGANRPYPLPTLTPTQPVQIAPGAIELIGNMSLYMIWAAGNQCYDANLDLVFNVTWQPLAPPSPTDTPTATPSATGTAPATATSTPTDLPTATNTPVTVETPPAVPVETPPVGATPVIEPTPDGPNVGGNGVSQNPSVVAGVSEGSTVGDPSADSGDVTSVTVDTGDWHSEEVSVSISSETGKDGTAGSVRSLPATGTGSAASNSYFSRVAVALCGMTVASASLLILQLARSKREHGA